MHIIPEADATNQHQAAQEWQVLLKPETWILKHLPYEPYYYGYGKYDAPAPQHYGRVTAPLIRFVNDVEMVCYLKVHQLCNQQNSSNNRVCQCHILFQFLILSVKSVFAILI